jgi:hypothetical protein
LPPLPSKKSQNPKMNLPPLVRKTKKQNNKLSQFKEAKKIILMD